MLSKIIRIREVTARTGLSRPTIWRNIRSGDFPKSFPISGHAVGWLESDITTWIEERAKLAGTGHFNPVSLSKEKSLSRRGRR